MGKIQPIAFMSYARTDDAYGHLTSFRERLSQEVRTQTGDEFPIFQDRNDILWGQNWKERIEDSLDGATFLIPILTPSFFKSPACRSELERFLERERKLKRGDLILPVYYVDCPVLSDETRLASDRVAQTIASRQRADWRELRFEPYTSPQVGRMLAQLGVQIRGALERTLPPAKQAVEITATPKSGSGTPARPAVAASEGETPARAVSKKTEVPTRTVDAMHRGDHSTIGEAILAAKAGDRILVRPGLYREGLVIDKPVEIVGDGEVAEVVVEATGKSAITFRANMGRVVNLTLRQVGGGECYGVDIEQGRLELEGCDISSRSFACVGIHGGADPRLRRNSIHSGSKGGVFVYEGSQGTLEDNEIFENALAGVEIRSGANPTLRRNRIHHGKQGGVMAHENGQGILEDNEIFQNAFTGVEIKSGASPTLRRNRVFKNHWQAVWIHDAGGGVIEDNDLRDNTRGPSIITDDSKPRVKWERNQE